LALGAGLLLALRIGLRYAIGGPLGLVLASPPAPRWCRTHPQPEGHHQEGRRLRTLIREHEKRYDEFSRAGATASTRSSTATS